jgi:hypothetical protein
MINQKITVIPEAKLTKDPEFKTLPSGAKVMNLNFVWNQWDPASRKTVGEFYNGALYDKFKIEDKNMMSLMKGDTIYSIICEQTHPTKVIESKRNPGEMNAVYTVRITTVTTPRLIPNDVAYTPPAGTQSQPVYEAGTVDEAAYDTMDI